MKRVAVITSGGDAPGMNAAVRSVVRKGICCGLEIVGYESGFQGIIEGKSKRLDLSSVGGIIDKGGTFLGTARSEQFMTKAGQDKALKTFEKDGIEGFIVIGGEGSYKGAQVFQKAGYGTVGIPGSIDNDIAGTDDSIGFDTCINTVAEAISKIRDTASAHERIFVIEVMGRTCGMIALYAGLAGGADFILVPEYPYNVDNVCSVISRGFDRGKLHSIIVVAEGVSSAEKVAHEIGSCVGHEVKKSVLGYIQRGGSPTAWDRVLASRMGSTAIDLLRDNKSGLAVGISGSDIIWTTLEYAYQNKRKLDKELLDLTAILAT
jgi:6-phosphofructokinase 1